MLTAAVATRDRPSIAAVIIAVGPIRRAPWPRVTALSFIAGITWYPLFLIMLYASVGGEVETTRLSAYSTTNMRAANSRPRLGPFDRFGHA